MSSTDIQATSSPVAKKRKLGFFARIILFIRQVFAELKKVTTPTRKELWNYFLVVLAFVVVMMFFVIGLDAIFNWLTNLLFLSTF